MRDWCINNIQRSRVFRDKVLVKLYRLVVPQLINIEGFVVYLQGLERSYKT
jgi:hypothetical protein